MPTLTDRRQDWKFVLELYRLDPDGEDGEQIANAKVKSDFDPIVETARFELLKRDPRPFMQIGAEPACVEPVWHELLGEPYVESIRVVVAPQDASPAECLAPTAFFRVHAEAAAAKLISEGVLDPEEKFRYLVTAYARDTDVIAKQPAFTIEPVAQDLHLEPKSLTDLFHRSRPTGPVRDEEVPVFVPQFILDECCERLHATGAAETGGILLGQIAFDPESHRLFLEVTAQIPAQHTQQELTSLTFTPETWSAVDAAIRLRGSDEMQLGWWHTHPAREWCKNCPEENRRVCKRSGEFFSSDDAALHRTVFPRAYSVGLVISDSYASGLTFPMFGWNRGLVEQRGFHVLRD